MGSLKQGGHMGLMRIIGLGLVAALWVGSGCGEERHYISIGTAPVGGAFYTVGGAISDTVNANRGERPWNVTAESTGGSMENIRLLARGQMQFAISNASITYFAVRGEQGWAQAYPTRSVMTLFPNVAMFVTRADSGITRISDLRGRRVYIGPEGAGFEYFVRPILEAHGLTLDDIQPVYASQQNAVSFLGDGSVAAAMIGGGVPTPAIVQAASSMDVLLIPFDEDAKAKLIRDFAFFEPATIPADTYRGQSEDYHGLNVGSAHLVTNADVDEQLVYEMTRVIFENREQIAARHAAARAINERNAVKDTGTSFHEGAIRYYREIGIWPEQENNKAENQ